MLRQCRDRPRAGKRYPQAQSTPCLRSMPERSTRGRTKSFSTASVISTLPASPAPASAAPPIPDIPHALQQTHPPHSRGQGAGSDASMIQTRAREPSSSIFSHTSLVRRMRKYATPRVVAPSLHHVKLVHGSEPNRSNDRRIGLAIRYIPSTSNRGAGFRYSRARRRPRRQLRSRAASQARSR
jgi:hypothetical protein